MRPGKEFFTWAQVIDLKAVIDSDLFKKFRIFRYSEHALAMFNQNLETFSG
jgi:hypothetical protein